MSEQEFNIKHLKTLKLFDYDVKEAGVDIQVGCQYVSKSDIAGFYKVFNNIRKHSLAPEVAIKFIKENAEKLHIQL